MLVFSILLFICFFSYNFFFLMIIITMIITFQEYLWCNSHHFHGYGVFRCTKPLREILWYHQIMIFSFILISYLFLYFDKLWIAYVWCHFQIKRLKHCWPGQPWKKNSVGISFFCLEEAMLLQMLLLYVDHIRNSFSLFHFNSMKNQDKSIWWYTAKQENK